MSEFEDRQDATPAIDTPAAAASSAARADATAEAASEANETHDDLETAAAVEGVTEPGDPHVYPEISDATAGEEPPLLDDTLEDGIASVFAALQAAARNGEIGEVDDTASPLSDDEATDGITFRLLGELDRLWHRAA